MVIEYGGDLDGDGLNDIRLTFALDKMSNSDTEDMIGVAFDMYKESGTFPNDLNVRNLQVSSKYGGSVVPKVPVGVWIDPGEIPCKKDSGCKPTFNIEGKKTLVLSPYDLAVQFGDKGSGRDGVVQKASFEVFSASQHVDGSALVGSNFYVRLQSTNGGGGSAKTVGQLKKLCKFGPPMAPE